MIHKNRIGHLIAVVLCLLALPLASCDGDDSDAGNDTGKPPPPDMNGAWAGLWSSGSLGNNMVLNVTDANGELAGDISFDLFPCMSVATIKGTRTDTSFQFQAITGPTVATFVGSFTTTATGKELTADFTFNEGPCTNENGKISLTATSQKPAADTAQ